MKKRNNNRFLLFLGTIALALGFGVTLKQKDINRVGAAPIPARTELFLKPNDNWLMDNSGVAVRFAAYFFIVGGEDAWTDLVAEPGVYNIYKTTSPAQEYDKVIFTRMKGDELDNNWENKINQTGDLEFDGTNNLFVLSHDTWDGQTTSWIFYDPADHPLPVPIPSGTEFRVTHSSAWFGTAHHLAAYYFRAGENAWVSGSEVRTNLWKTIAPTPANPNDEWDKVIFVAMPQEQNKWDGNPKQTPNLIWDGVSNLYDITSEYWVTYLPTTPLPEGIDRNHVRLWIDRGGHYDTTDYMYVLNIGEHNYTPSGYTKALVFETDGIYFPYFDLPVAGLSGSNIEIIIVNSHTEHTIDTIGTVPFIAGDNNKLWRVGRNADNSDFEVTKGALIGRVYASFLAKVLEGYLTCDANTDNGYMAFGQIDANFIPRTTDGEGKEVWNVEGSLGGIMIKDYENEANYLTGERETEANTDAYAKYMRMQTLFLANGGTLGGAPERVIPVAQSSNNLIMLFGIMFAFGLIGFIAYKKKRA